MMPWMKKTISALAAASLFAGCAASGSNISTPSAKPQPEEISANLRDQYFAFAWDLLEQNREDKTSSLVSPVSALFALGMTANGAAGQTQKQMESALKMDTEQINTLSKSLVSFDEADGKGQLRLANSMWIREDASSNVKPEFSRILEDDYQAEVFETDFGPSTQKKINAWIDQKTNGMIDQLNLPLSAQTMAVLLNALAFNAQWNIPYDDRDIQTGTFLNADGTESEVTMLHSLESSWIETQGLVGTIKPYEGDTFSLVLLRPENDQPLEEVLDNLDEEKLLEAVRMAESAEVTTVFPEFELSSDLSLNSALQAMGMTDAFSDQADFSNLMDAPLSISEVRQKNRIEVSRTGTKAAVATAVEIQATGALILDQKEIVFDRPFLFILMQDDMPLLIGTIQSMEAATES